MEAFSLLKYWKTTATGGVAARVGALGGSGSGGFPLNTGSNGTTTTIVAARDFESEADADAGDDEGPFFDLEFAVPEEDDDEEILKVESQDGEIGEIVAEYDDDDDDDDGDDGDDDDGDDGGRERELKLRPSSSTSSYENEHSDSNVVSLSPSEEALFKGQLVRIEGEEDVSSKSGQIPIPASLLRSATKFRVLMLKLKRSKSDSIATTATAAKSQPQKQTQQHNNKKLFTVKFKVEEVPVISRLSRASSNSKSNTTTADENPATSTSDSGDEKRNKKEIIQKYLKLVKPLNIRVSKRNQLPAPPPAMAETSEKEDVVVATAEKSEVKGQKGLVGLNLKGMMMAKKHLGKSKSAVVHSNSNMQNVVSNRRDDSLLQQQDGIQGAILHCKRSFNNSSTPDLEEKEDAEAGLVLTRSASDPSHEKKRTSTTTMELTREREDKNDAVVVG